MGDPGSTLDLLNNISEREILEKLDQLESAGVGEEGTSGSAELSGYRVTEVLLMPKGSLNLSYRGLASLSDDLFQLPVLTSLDLKCNSITVVPGEVSRLVSLRFLDLSRYPAQAAVLSAENAAQQVYFMAGINYPTFQRSYPCSPSLLRSMFIGTFSLLFQSGIVILFKTRHKRFGK